MFEIVPIKPISQVKPLFYLYSASNIYDNFGLFQKLFVLKITQRFRR